MSCNGNLSNEVFLLTSNYIIKVSYHFSVQLSFMKIGRALLQFSKRSTLLMFVNYSPTETVVAT